jgi:hypothetical protein
MVAATAPQFECPQHHDGSDAEDRCTVFETGDNLRRRHVTGKPTDEKVADSLIEHQFDRYAGIGAREHRSERLLLLSRLSLQHPKIVLMSCCSASNVAPITVHEFT